MGTTEPIRPHIAEMFEALRDPNYDNFGLLSVTYDGVPT